MRGRGYIIGRDCWGRVGGTSKQPSTMQETAITGWPLAVGRVRGWFGAGKNIYLDSYHLIRIITPICAPQRGRDGMDCVGVGWMTRSINRSCHQLGAEWLLGFLGSVFHCKKDALYLMECIYIQYNVLCRSGQATMDGWHRTGSDDDIAIRHVLSVGARFYCCARWAWCSIAKHV
jgi:hypothetical protein